MAKRRINPGDNVIINVKNRHRYAPVVGWLTVIRTFGNDRHRNIQVVDLRGKEYIIRADVAQVVGR